MYKVKVLKNFCDESGEVHYAKLRDSSRKVMRDEKLRTIPVIKEMDEKTVKFALSIKAIQILEKPKPKTKAKKSG